MMEVLGNNYGLSGRVIRFDNLWRHSI